MSHLGSKEAKTKTFGEKLQRLRKARGMSQEDLAGMLSVTRQTIFKWELGQSAPELEYISQLSDLFGVTTDYLIKSSETPSAPAVEIRVEETKPEQGEKSGKRHLPTIARVGWGGSLGGLLGIILLDILSKAFPVHIIGSGVPLWAREGLWAFLYSKSLWVYFWVCVIAFAIGIALLLWYYVYDKNVPPDEPK